jgi:hypothetical protein
MNIPKLSRALFRVGILWASLATASAQTTCTASSAVPLLARSEGNTELVGDIVLVCTGGLPTPAGAPVPQINLTVVLNTNVTSLVTEAPTSGDFSEALLLVDEPNRAIPPSAVLPSNTLLNCGQTGAPDNGPSGPGVCEIISTGNPAQTYDGTPNVMGTTNCVMVGAVPQYPCGRPNAFQGRLGASVDNVIQFLGIPFDPPAAGSQRILRITNLRANAAALGSGGPHSINVDVQETGSTSFTITPSVLTVAFSFDGLVASVSSPGVVRVTEGFASAWKDRNVAFTLANAVFSAGAWNYAGTTNYPTQAAQNVPGVFYNTEDGFQWQNNGANAPPSPDPPPGFGTGVTTNLNYPLGSVGYGGVNTGISGDGVSSAGTRIALSFFAFGETVTIPPLVYLHPVSSPSTTSGVMVLTSTDPAGAGAFTPGASTTIHNIGTAVYEVLYANPFVNEYADIPCAVSGPLHFALAYVSFAPFYTVPGARFATPTPAHPTPTAIPRFDLDGALLWLAPDHTATPSPSGNQ